MEGIINHNGRLMRGKVRRDGWTPARRKTFLDVLAATGCVGEAERAAGMGEGSARRLRRHDAQFAGLWEAALAEAYRRLEEELLAYALGRVADPLNPGPERDEPAGGMRSDGDGDGGGGRGRAIDPRLALAILRMRGRTGRPGPYKPVAPLDPAEVDRRLMAKLADLSERMGPERLRAERLEAERLGAERMGAERLEVERLGPERPEAG